MTRKPMLIILAILAAAGSVEAAVNVQTNPDGTKYSAVLVNGPSSLKYDIVFVGDGFTSAQQATFNARVNDAVAALQARVPYSERMCALNIWRVNVISAQSGVDHPFPAPGVFKNTELDCRYGNPDVGEAERCITSNSPAKCFEAAGYAPAYDAVFVLVNDTQWGGCAGGLVFSSISPGFAGIITHELGHKIGALADEYNCYVCDGSDSTAPYAGPEPAEVNVTKQTALANIKWNDLILGGTPIPTTVDSPAGVVGLWEGAKYKPNGLYRPQNNCHMRNGTPFCQVCERKMRADLTSRCTACEIDPSSFKCLFGDLLAKIRFQYVDPLRLRWPLPFCPTCPVCLTCPPFEREFFDEIILLLQGVPQGFMLEVLDDKGEIIARGDHGTEGLRVQFMARRDTGYFFELTSDAEPTGQTIELLPTLTRNGQEQGLPGGP